MLDLPEKLVLTIKTDRKQLHAIKKELRQPLMATLELLGE